MKSILAWVMTVIVVGLALPGVAHADDTKKDKTSETSEEEERTDAEHREDVVKWVVGFIAKHAPPGRKTYYVEAQETKKDAIKRHRSIAEDLVEIVYNPKTKPAFRGKTGRARTISVMLGIALYESGFGKNVDYGIGKYGRGDGGNSWCLMQMNVGSGRAWKNAGGWNTKHDRPWNYGDKKEDIVVGASGPEMVKDRRKCFTEALRLIKISFKSCRKNSFNRRLNVYASGSCKKGGKGSTLRMKAATKFWVLTKKERKDFDDKPVVAWVKTELANRTVAEAKAMAAKKKAERAKQAELEKKKKKKKKEAKGGSGKTAKSKSDD